MKVAATPQGGPVARRQTPRPTSSSVSVIVPVSERPTDLAELYREYAAPLREMGGAIEFLFVIEPQYAPLAQRLEQLARDGEPIRVLVPGHALGEAALVKAGAGHCEGEIIVTLPAYFRVAPQALPELVRRVEAGADLVAARRWPRRDRLLNRLQTRAFHFLIGGLAGGVIHDVACGVRAMRSELLRDVPLYGDFFRFLPILAHREGYRVEELDAPQHPDDVPTRLYAPSVYLRRLVDALGLMFLVRFTDKPLRFFGVTGAVIALAGGAILLGLLIQKLGGAPLADRPLLLMGVLLVVLGAQAVALGLVGEIIVHVNAPQRRPYRIAAASDVAVMAGRHGQEGRDEPDEGTDLTSRPS